MYAWSAGWIRSVLAWRRIAFMHRMGGFDWLVGRICILCILKGRRNGK